MDELSPNFIINESVQEAPKRSPKRSIFLILTVFGILFLAGCALYNFYPRDTNYSPDDIDPVTLEPKTPEGFLKKLQHFVFNRNIRLEGEKNDRINILLLGMGGIGHDGPYLTDTIMIASIKPSTKQISLISIPRDLGVDIPSYGLRKINLANSVGETNKANWGGAYATELVEKLFNININYYIRLDFSAFQKIIDEVRGVTVNVDRSFVDQMFPAQNNEYQTITFASGIQTMNGERALQYARSRHGSNGEGSDFARADRQQKVLLALKEKIFSFSTLANPIKISNIMTTLEKHITTNMQFADIIALVKLGNEMDTNNIIRLTLDDSVNGCLVSGRGPDGAYLLLPKTGNFDEISSLIKNIFDENSTSTRIVNDTPTQIAPPAFSSTNIELQNGTWRVGLAARMEKRLEDRGFIIETINNTLERPQPESGIYVIDTKAPRDVIVGLEQELHLSIKGSTLPPGVFIATSTKILIILGENMEE